MASAVSAERWQELDDIDPAWCPAWSVAWQRCFRLARTHLSGGGTLSEKSGLLLIQGEDIGHWAQAQRAEWNLLVPAQQWLLAEVLGLEPLEEPVPVSARAAAAVRVVRAVGSDGSPTLFRVGRSGSGPSSTAWSLMSWAPTVSG